MAYYVNGTLISGANTLPKMTMAEYLALSVSERPTYWECTDKDYVDISAENVTYGSGSVKDALDEVNTVEILATTQDSYNGVWTLMRCGHTYSLSIYNNNIAGQTMPAGKIDCPFAVDSSWLPIYNAVTMSTSQAGHIWNVGVGPTGISGWMYTADASQRFITVTWLK